VVATRSFANSFISGDPIVAGLTLSVTRMILAGAISARLLAPLVDAVLALAEKRLLPRGATVT
jgi:ABC-type proline/glycine betaine transport system permease subunit